MPKIFDIHKIWSYIISSIIAFFEPIGALLLWLFVFVMIDMITGMIASSCEGKIITSKKWGKTIVKIFMYSTTISLLHGIDVDMLIFPIGLAKVCSTLICGIELYSILENFYRITGNSVFRILTQFTLKKIEDQTGVEIKHTKKRKAK